jgi:hypothetical protein
MRASVNNLVKVITTGFIVLTLLSLPLFWLRYICEGNLIEDVLPYEARKVHLEPSGLVPDELERDPNVISHSHVEARLRHGGTLGITKYFTGIVPGEDHGNIYFFDNYSNSSDWQVVYFDQSTGYITCRYAIGQRMPDKTLIRKEVQLYAGPEGFSEIPDKKLGKFIYPVVDTTGNYRNGITLYDKKLRRFFNVDFDKRTVVKGPQLSKDDPHKPIEIGLLRKNSNIVNLNWYGPQAKPSVVNIEKERQDQFLLVLDATGRIDLLDRETLEFSGTAGYLPAPNTLFPGRQDVRPKDLLAYEVIPPTLETDHQFRGMFVAGVNREGTAMTLDIFNKEGRRVSRHSSMYQYEHYFRENYIPVAIPSSEAVYFHIPWGPVLTITKYLLENLHPPILSILSYFTAESFEAGAGHRALFVLPNSFIAMKGRDMRAHFAERFITALLLILPSITLSLFFVWRVNKDATLVGFSKNAKLFWIIGTISFGLAAYITYRLTRPKITLVTCQNCGKPRRPDMDLCHRCKSKWHVPELIPPRWRVVN